MRISIQQKTKDALQSEGVNSWPIWEKEVSEFDWYYSEKEMCYILSGKAIITSQKETIVINAGDYVVFPKGLQCHWKIIETITKHYNFE